MATVEGKVAFANLDAHEIYNGKDTGYFSVVITLDEQNAKKLEDAGVHLREYKNVPQRKFKTQYKNFKVIDADGDEYLDPIGFGDLIRIQWKEGQPSPANGTPTYLNAIRVLEPNPDKQVYDEDF